MPQKKKVKNYRNNGTTESGRGDPIMSTYVGILKPMTWGEIGLEAKITKKLWT